MKARGGWLIAIAALLPGQTLAAERTLSVTDFDRLRVEGNFIVEVIAGRSTSARITGTPDAIDTTTVQGLGRTLTIRRTRLGWVGTRDPSTKPPVIRLTVPTLSNIWSSGAAAVRIDRMKGPRIGVSLEGSGSVTVADVQADALDLGVIGSGRVEMSGKVAGMTGVLRGAVELASAKLTVADLRLTSENSGTAVVTATRSANVTATGSGSVTVFGKPACTVRNLGSGNVDCGASQQPQTR